MPDKAKLFIKSTIALGFLLIAATLLSSGQYPDLWRYCSYFSLALIASTLKVRLPGLTGTISTNFLFILVGIVEFSFAETITMGCAAVVVQCMWKARKRPLVIQVLFNISVMALSVGASYFASHVALFTSSKSLPVELGISACLYFVCNTMLVSTLFSMLDRKPVKQVWQHCYMWAFPYYLAGAVVAGLIIRSNEVIGWKMSLALLPIMYMIYVFYRIFVMRTQLPAASRTAA